MLPLFMLLTLVLVFDPTIRNSLGAIAGLMLDPTIRFSGDLPLMTALIAGTVPALLSTVLRHYMTDWIAMAKSQEANKALQKELMQATRAKNTAKLKKLQEKRLQMMSSMSDVQMQTMKPTLITMFFFIMIFAWLGNFLYAPETVTRIAVPWSDSADLLGVYLFPAWVWLYMILSYPLIATFGRLLKFFSFRERLRAMRALKA
jgi:uncharacterized membrane protein (DUF106 family)